MCVRSGVVFERENFQKSLSLFRDFIVERRRRRRPNDDDDDANDFECEE